MVREFSYKDYVTDEKFLDEYNTYQNRYLENIRESDRVLISLIKEIINERDQQDCPPSLLDVGCSTGNLLFHLKKVFPDLSYMGVDLAESSLDECRVNPELETIEFQSADILKLSCGTFDIVTVNAVLYMMEEFEFEQALKSLSATLKKGGRLVAFDFFHSFDQHLSILEKSRSHPEGLELNFRSMDQVKRQLKDAGFSACIFYPFTLPIDLPLIDDGELVTYTRTDSDGGRMPFRGTLFQPWCHLVASKD